ncbi:MAG: N-acetylneuraminate synthase family protein [Bacillota bacterium]|nr:N-acetylneuraminate synthase family protein [Bacillota bacterium]MDW7684833.1 N-acetylneuraminate synthase family protein [Bacillota bacterium]
MLQLCKPYIIGETAYHHEGDMQYLLALIDLAAAAGLNAVKFHLLLDLDSYMHREHSLRKQLESWMFLPGQWDKILAYAADRGLDIITLCNDEKSIDFVLNTGLHVTAVEIHSSAINDCFLLQATARFKGIIILHVGGCTLEEISFAIECLRRNGTNNIVLMHGFQNYPTHHKDIQLSIILKLKQLFHLPVGYADHTDYSHPYNAIISSFAAAMGINVLEKHITLVPGEKRTDYHAAVDKDKLVEIRMLMNLALTAYGSGCPDVASFRDTDAKKKVVARKKILKGARIRTDDLAFKRTAEESNITNLLFLELPGSVALRDIEQDEIVDFSKVKAGKKK